MVRLATSKEIKAMREGHLAVAKELGIELTLAEAESISRNDAKNSTCLFNTVGGYVVYKHSPSITGDLNFLTKLYTPIEHRGKGLAKKLLDRCERPLVTSEKLIRIR